MSTGSMMSPKRKVTDIYGRTKTIIKDSMLDGLRSSLANKMINKIDDVSGTLANEKQKKLLRRHTKEYYMGDKKDRKRDSNINNIFHGAKNTLLSLNRMNCLPIDGQSLTDLIIRTVRKSEINVRTHANKVSNKFGKKKVYENNVPIKWPPSREDLRNLMRALNLRFTERSIIEMSMISRGPKMDDEPKEGFDINKLVKWFQLNLHSIQHENLDLVEKEWIYENPHVLASLPDYLFPEHLKHLDRQTIFGGSPERLGHPTPHKAR